MIAAIRAELPAIADDIIGAIPAEVPEYSAALRGDFGDNIRLGTEQALERFVSGGRQESSAIYRTLGYGEQRAGRSLDALQSAYRVGARLAWRRMSAVAAAAGASGDTQRRLAEAIFSYIDTLAAEAVEGFAAAQTASAEDTARARSLLLALLVQGSGVDPTTLRAAAAEARWALPRRVCCLAVEELQVGALARRLSGDTLSGSVGDSGCVVLPDPSGHEAEVASAASRLQAAVGIGPTGGLAAAERSWRWARAALGLAEGPEAVAAGERLADIAVSSAPDVLDGLRERALRPLGGETEASRRRLEATLRSWLRHFGSQKAIAAELSVHPQTVRYRIARLRDLFGGALDDPDARFGLAVALRGVAPESPASQEGRTAR